MRDKFSFAKSKGNKTVLTIMSRQQTLDTRIDMQKVPSPSSFDMFLPAANADLRDQLIKLVSEYKKAILASF